MTLRPPGRRALLGSLPALVAFVFVVLTVLASTKATAVDGLFPGRAQRAVFAVFPQGWEFFTRSPRESYVEPYRETGVELSPLSLLPSGQPRHWFGFSRRARAQGVELAGLIHEANEADGRWTECTSAPAEECVRHAAGHVPVRSQVERPSLCDEVVLVEYEPWPWSYRDYLPEDLPAIRALRVDVDCER